MSPRSWMTFICLIQVDGSLSGDGRANALV
jgi:hypothetical protein